MANKTLFPVKSSRHAPKHNTVNAAGGKAYKLDDAETLCQFVVTSCFNDVYYATGRDQLDEVLKICQNVDPVIIAKAAVYGAEHGRMKDAPALLTAVLAAKRQNALLEKVFPRVITTKKMLMNFVQILRSGTTGRKSFGSVSKRLINNWITSRTGTQLFHASIGASNPKLTDVLRMTHPNPASAEQNALFGYLLGKDYNPLALPEIVQGFEAFKKDNTQPIPPVNYVALTNCDLTVEHWKDIADKMPWNTLRMNLTLLQRNKVFDDSDMTSRLAKKLADPEQVRKFNAFPYQLLTTFQNVTDVPQKIRLALQDAMEVATESVPVLGDKVAVCVDVSGSMSSPVTGNRGKVSTKTRCVDAAALIAASIARTNQEADIISFADRARVTPGFNPRDSVMTNAQKLATESSYCGWGTNAGTAMQVIIDSGKKYDFIIYLSDCQSWADRTGYRSSDYWETYKRKSKNCKLVEINLQPYGNTQLSNSDPRVMNIGGISDGIFPVLEEFAHRDMDAKFLDVINSVEL